MNTWNQRLKEKMSELGLTQEVLASKMGITRAAITHYLAGRRVPPLAQFQKLAFILKTEPAWLQFGVTSKKSKPDLKVKDSASIVPILTLEQAGKSAYVNSQVKEDAEKVPCFCTQPDDGRLYAVRVKGDSMIASSGYEKSFYENDILVVDPDKKLVHGCYVIASLARSKEAIFKQYVKDGDKTYLKPLNKQYPLIEVSSNLIVHGVVIARIDNLFPVKK